MSYKDEYHHHYSARLLVTPDDREQQADLRQLQRVTDSVYSAAYEQARLALRNVDASIAMILGGATLLGVTDQGASTPREEARLIRTVLPEYASVPEGVMMHAIESYRARLARSEVQGVEDRPEIHHGTAIAGDGLVTAAPGGIRIGGVRGVVRLDECWMPRWARAVLRREAGEVYGERVDVNGAHLPGWAYIERPWAYGETTWSWSIDLELRWDRYTSRQLASRFEEDWDLSPGRRSLAYLMGWDELLTEGQALP